MKIAIVTNYKLGYGGGGEVWVIAVSQRLVASGHRVDVYVPEDPTIPTVPCPTGVRVLEYVSPAYTCLVRLGLRNFVAPFIRPGLLPNYDVVYFTSIFHVRASRENVTSTIVGTHDFYVPNRMPSRDILRTIPLLMWCRASRHRSVRFHSLGAPISAELERFGLKFFEIGNFAPPGQIRPDVSDTFRLLYVGRVSRRKGARLLFEFAKRVGGRPEVELAVVGAVDPEFDDVAKAVGSAHRNVHVLGRVPDVRLSSLLSHTDLTIHLSDREADPFVPIESLVSGIPVVSTWQPLSRLYPQSGVSICARSLPALEASVGVYLSRWRASKQEYLEYKRGVQETYRSLLSSEVNLTRLCHAFENARGAPL